MTDVEYIKRLPAADVAEVRHGRWGTPFWRMLRLKKIYAAVLQT